MKCKILPFPKINTNEARLKAISKALMDDADCTEEILKELLNYWGELHEYNTGEYLIFFHLQRAYEYVLHLKGFELE